MQLGYKQTRCSDSSQQRYRITSNTRQQCNECTVSICALINVELLICLSKSWVFFLKYVLNGQ